MDFYLLKLSGDAMSADRYGTRIWVHSTATTSIQRVWIALLIRMQTTNLSSCGHATIRAATRYCDQDNDISYHNSNNSNNNNSTSWLSLTTCAMLPNVQCDLCTNITLYTWWSGHQGRRCMLLINLTKVAIVLLGLKFHFDYSSRWQTCFDISISKRL